MRRQEGSAAVSCLICSQTKPASEPKKYFRVVIRRPVIIFATEECWICRQQEYLAFHNNPDLEVGIKSGLRYFELKFITAISPFGIREL